MRKANFIFTLVISFVSIAPAAELGNSRASNSTSRQTPAVSGYARIVAPERIATQLPGKKCQTVVGLCSILEVSNALSAAQRKLQEEMGRRNIALTTRNKNVNITNFKGYSPQPRRGTVSCYGTKKDGFIGGPTLVGPMNPLQTAAACAPSLRGKIVILRNPRTNVARAITCVDTGAFDSKYGRMMDVYASVFDLFGLRCDKDGLMRDMEMYVPTAAPSTAVRAPAAKH